MSQELSLEARLALIDSEIRTLHEFCVNKGYNPWEIEASAGPIFELIQANRRQTWLRRGKTLLIFITILLGLFYIDPAYRLLCSYSKRASIQLLPYWRWDEYHSQDCFLENPYYVGLQLTKEDCELCEGVVEIERVANVSHTIMAEDYITRETPVIVKDGLKDWKAYSMFNIHFLSDLYEKESTFETSEPCMWGSNVRSKSLNPSPGLLLGKASMGEITNWYAHWENCDKKQARFLRQFYKRPYFIPPMVEMAETNWLFISSHFKPKTPKPADIGKSFVLFAQLKGTVKVALNPRPPCNDSCTSLYATLHPGQSLVFTEFLWYLDYSPQGSAETISVAWGGNFD